MTDDATSDRRAFLLRLARTAAYSAPVIHTLAAPRTVQGQGLSGKMTMIMAMGIPEVVTPFTPSLPSAPWGQGTDNGPD